MPPVGGKPVSFRLQDFRGGWHRLDEAGGGKVVVVAFLGTECPMASLYAPRLAELARSYEKKGVAFFGVDSNQQDAPSALSRFAREHDLPFPLLKDVGNELADRLGVERTPEVFVLDAGRVVRYRGRVDDQYGFGVHRPSPTHRDLAAALDDLLAGRSVATPRTEPVGCRIGRVAKGGGMRPSRTRSRSPASCATAASPATATGRSRRSRWRRTSRPPAGRR